MASDVFPRGATVRISVQFLDADGAPVAVGSATAYLSYRDIDGVRASEVIALSQSGDNWVGSWDSRVACAGTISGHVRSPPSLPISAANFSFSLQSNQANPSS